MPVSWGKFSHSHLLVTSHYLSWGKLPHSHFSSWQSHEVNFLLEDYFSFPPHCGRRTCCCLLVLISSSDRPVTLYLLLVFNTQPWTARTVVVEKGMLHVIRGGHVITGLLLLAMIINPSVCSLRSSFSLSLSSLSSLYLSDFVFLSFGLALMFFFFFWLCLFFFFPCSLSLRFFTN